MIKRHTDVSEEVIENEAIQMVVSKKYGLVGLKSIHTGRQYIYQGLPNRPLFRLLCSEFQEGWVQPGEIPLSSYLAAEIFTEWRQNELLIGFNQLDDLDINVFCMIRLDEKKGFSYWRIKIENHSSYAIRSIEYPILHIITPLGKSATDDRILLPKQDGYLLPSPLVQEWKGDYPFRRLNQRFAYPGEGREFPASLCAQLLAYYNNEEGLYIATYDNAGHPKQLGPIQMFYENDIFLDFTPVHLLPEQIGNGYNSSYETAVGCFSGDWQDAANIYKVWSIQQPWCSKTLSERDDIPAWIKNGAFFFNFRLRGQWDGEAFLERVPKYLKEWQDTLGIPLVAMMCGWEKRGEWVGPDYFPPYGDKRFAIMCYKLKNMGIQPFPFGLSGLKLPIRKKIGRDWPQPELAIDFDNRIVFEKRYRQYAAIDSCGRVITDSPVASWDGLHGYACVSTLQAKEQLYGACIRLLEEYGIRVSQADQIFGGGTTECYHPNHSHLPGRGVWQVDTLQQIYKAIRTDAKKLDRDFALSQEFPSELFIQYLDICHGRVSDQPRGVMGIPLFAYLYHEYLVCYGGDWSSMLNDNTCGVYVQGNNFVSGSLPAGCPQSMFKNMRNEYPHDCNTDILYMAKNTSHLIMRFQQYLILGKMCKSTRLEVPDIQVMLNGMDFAGWGKNLLIIPAVLHCLWQSPKRCFAYAFANISKASHTITLPDIIPDIGKIFNACLWINQKKGYKASKNRGVIEFSLEPLDVAILELSM